MPEPIFQIFIKNLATMDEFEIPFLAVDFTDELNKGKNAKFSFDYQTAQRLAEVYNTTPLFIFTGGTREIRIEKNGVSIYVGVLTDSTIGKDDKGLLRIEVASVGFANLLNKRRTDDYRQFVSTDAGMIAWTLIDESQLSDVPYSDLGITQGLIQSSVNRDRTFRFYNILEAIFKMSNENLLNGFDYEVDNLKKFNVFYPQKGSQRPDIFIDIGNIISWRFKKPLILNLTNQVYVLGEGQEDSLVWVKRTSPVAYSAAFGLLEDVLSERDTGTTANLNDKGDKFLNDHQSPDLDLEVTHKDGNPDLLNYDVGDSLKVNIPEAEIIDEFRRIEKRTVKIDTQSQAIVTITFD